MKAFTTFLLSLLTIGLFAQQSARLQIVHNSPTPTVDIWVNGQKLLSDFEFRTATPFIDVPAGVELNVGVAPSPSNDPSEIIASFPFTLDADQTYIAVANGVVGDPDAPFDIEVIAPAREAAAMTGNVDLAVFHGSPDAPAVDVYARNVGQLVSNTAFGDATGYLEVPEDRYILDITAAGSPDIVISYEANLNGLAGGAGLVFASGFLVPGMGQPGFGLFVALPDGNVVELPTIQAARLQVIHNSPSPTVDIWVNGQKFLSDFAFRQATPFVEVPAGVELEIGVAPAPSNDPSEIIATFPVTLENGETYIAIANGVVGDPNTPFNIEVVTPAREAAVEAENVDLAVFHGSPDAPAVDVYARGVGQLVSNAAFGDATGYLEVPEGRYILDITAAGSPDIVISYEADLNGLAGGAGLVFASGFLSPGMGQPGFGLFVALPDGNVVELPTIQAASLQVVHNSPSPTVDIWVNGQKFLSDFAFRTATSFVEVPAGVELEIGVAPAPSTDPSEIIATFPVTLENGQTYIAIANGVVGDPNTPFALEVINPARASSANSRNFDVAVFHGSPDAPAVDVSSNVGPLLTNLAYGESTGYVELPAGRYILDLFVAGTQNLVDRYDADLNGLAGGAGVVFASGFVNPGMGQPAFGLFLALADGTVVELPVISQAELQIVHNSPSPTVDLWVNGQKFISNFEYRTATSFVEVPAGVELQVGVAPAPSNDPSEIIATFPLTLEKGEKYIAIANGIVGDPNTPFNIEVITPAQTEATDPNNVDAVVFHGSPDAPSVDVYARGVAQLVSNLAYAEATDYLNIPAGNYLLDITAAGSPDPVVSYLAPLSGIAGSAGLVMASGFLNPGPGQPGFALLVVFPNGAVAALPQIANSRVQIIHNAPSPTVDIWINDQKALDAVEFRTATPFLDFLTIAGEAIEIGVAPSPSTDPSQIIARFPVTLENGESYIAIANGVVGDPNTPFNIEFIAGARDASGDQGNVDLLVFHGSPDAPEVDVLVNGTTPPLVDNLAFAENTGYVTVPTGVYDLGITPADDNSNVLVTFRADVTSLGGGAGVVFASGFLNGMPGFGLWVALPDGTVFPLPVVTGTNQQVLNAEVDVFPNPTTDWLSVRTELNESTDLLRYTIFDIKGQMVRQIDARGLGQQYEDRLDVSDLQNGQYIIRISNDREQSVILPFTVQK